MHYNNEIKAQGKAAQAKPPHVTSYDSCHEHSIEHLSEVRHLVEDFKKDEATAAQPRIIAAGKDSSNGST